MKTVAIIPARGGSKRFPSKNIAELDGKPLIYHTVEAALGQYDKIIVTSDSDNILEIVQNEYADYSSMHKSIFEISRRPVELASDTSKVIDTVVYYQEKNAEYDQIWLLLPTCPLRTKKDIINAQQLLTDDVDSIISITEYEFPPSLGLVKGAGGYITSYDWTDPWARGDTRSQDHPVIYRPNGAIYGSWMKSFIKNRNFYKGKVKGYYMPRERSVDIDKRLDLELARVVIRLSKHDVDLLDEYKR